MHINTIFIASRRETWSVETRVAVSPRRARAARPPLPAAAPATRLASGYTLYTGLPLPRAGADGRYAINKLPASRARVPRAALGRERLWQKAQRYACAFLTSHTNSRVLPQLA